VLAVLRDKLLSTNLDAGGKIPCPSDEVGQSAAMSLSSESAARRERIQRAMEDFFKQPRHQAEFSFLPAGSSRSSYSAAVAEEQKTLLSEASAAEASEQAECWHAREYLQVHNSYILLQSEDGFAVIDQHALHERILYEQMCKRLREGNLPSQRLLMPHSFEVTRAQLEAYESQKGLFEKLGIELVPFGPNTLAVQAFTALLENADPADFVRETLDKLVQDGGHGEPERLLHEILDIAACKAAVKAGQPLSEQEIAALLKDRGIIQRASRCPHGRPTTITFSLRDLEKQFKRTGF
jgi:DNA mismatch repair protein MutL